LEEHFEGYSLQLIFDRLNSMGIRPTRVIIGEATGLKLAIGQRGRAELILKTFGRSAHAANPQVGVNAVYLMTPIIDAVRKLTPPEDPDLGPGVYEVVDILSSPYPGLSVVPDECRITVDIRTIPGETEQSVLSPFQQILQAQKQRNRAFKGEVAVCQAGHTLPGGRHISVKKFPAAWKIRPSDPIVQTAVRALQSAGLDGELSTYRFCTNGSYSAGVAGIPTLGFGPSHEHLAHVVDEYIEIDQLIRAMAGYRALIDAFLGKE
jgi:acetylornithine deacetylase/succinyl-diaminopimelate desuccinylase-like protein